MKIKVRLGGYYGPVNGFSRCSQGRWRISTRGSDVLRYSHPMKSPPAVLSVAGFDPSSGAGITADVKTAAAHGCYAVTCPTALTVQSSLGVFEVRPVDPEFDPADRRCTCRRPGNRRGSGGNARLGGNCHDAGHVLKELKLRTLCSIRYYGPRRGPFCWMDPGVQVLRKELLPLADVITPNVEEAAILAGLEAAPVNAPWAEVLLWLRAATDKLRNLGSRAIIMTGGHLPQANDYLSHTEDGVVREEIFPGAHIESGSTHGTGCAFAMSIACQLALGQELPQAVRLAKDYVTKAIQAAYPLGKGIGSINHMV